MVHNELQYAFIYQFIHYWLNKLNIDDTQHYTKPKELEEENNEKSNSQPDEPTNEGLSENKGESQSAESEGEMIEQVPVNYESEENENLVLDMINKPPPIDRKNKPQFMF